MVYSCIIISKNWIIFKYPSVLIVFHSCVEVFSNILYEFQTSVEVYGQISGERGI